MDREDKTSLILNGAVSPNGGLVVVNDMFLEIESNTIGGKDYENKVAIRFFSKLQLSTKRQVFEFLMTIKALYPRKTLMFFIGHLLITEMMSMDDLYTLYKTQSDKDSPTSITLDDIHQVNFKLKEARLERENIQQELVDIANIVVNISLTDLSMFFEHWYYRAGIDVTPFTEKFFEHWYKESYSYIDYSTGRLFSLVTIAYNNQFPGKIELESVFERIERLIMYNPDSHGIQRYFSVCFYIAADNREQTRLVCKKYAEMIIRKLRSGGVNRLWLEIERFLEFDYINRENKQMLLDMIMDAIDDEIKSFLNLKGAVRRYKERL